MSMIATLILLGVAAILTTLAAPWVLPRALNRTLRHKPYPVSECAAKLHRSLVVADLHADALLWRRDLLRRSTVGHVDLPRLRAGNVAVQVFATVNTFPGAAVYHGRTYRLNLGGLQAAAQRWPLSTWRSAYARTLHQAAKLEALAKRSVGAVRIMRSARDLDEVLEARRAGAGVIGAVLAIEGATALEGEMRNVDALFSAGFRVLTITHFCDNAVGGSSNGLKRHGLTNFGRDVFARMEELSFIIDLAHASPTLIDDALECTTRPVMVSHTGLRDIWDDVRNLSDDQARAIADKGGIIGIGYWRDALGPPSLERIAETLCYGVELVGPGHMALGSDFDGGGAAPLDASELPALTEKLLRAGLDEDVIAGVMGGNAVGFLRQALPES
ncbi:MAG TPA: peptidase M19 [Candidatus Hydrogenedentes bacterium]|nr:peptidase M19 [Candidatus Hydrogenedentota bacterium]